ncbi:MAG: lipoate--protein ligase family protein [Peptococcaceae bacterium]|nr:lipoate--protein ligase family protein [Peptococcaceae bacterium]
MPNWRLINSGHLPGAMNMAIDEAIMQAVAAGKAPPTLRFYGWEPACLSLGYAQKADEVAWNACTAYGIDVVRRPTGGRAILHDQEVTYSITAAEDNPLVSGTILESYLKISQGLVLGLRNLGIPAEIVAQKDAAKLGTAACFDSPSFYELAVNGHKIVGSAQTRHNGVVLQHGSIIRAMDTAKLFAVLSFPSEEVREKMKAAFRRKACSLQDVLGPELTDAQIVAEVGAGFAAAFDITPVASELTQWEQELAAQLRESKYSTDEWNKKR